MQIARAMRFTVFREYQQTTCTRLRSNALRVTSLTCYIGHTLLVVMQPFLPHDYAYWSSSCCFTSINVRSIIAELLVTMLLKGSCHCRAVKFTVQSSTPVPFMRCYCSICRKTSGGGGYAVNLGADAKTLQVTLQCIAALHCQTSASSQPSSCPDSNNVSQYIVNCAGSTPPPSVVYVYPVYTCFYVYCAASCCMAHWSLLHPASVLDPSGHCQSQQYVFMLQRRFSNARLACSSQSAVPASS
jgi:hypothetical protein